MKKAVTTDNGLVAVVEDGKKAVQLEEGEAVLEFVPTPQLRAKINRICRITGMTPEEFVRESILAADWDKIRAALIAKQAKKAKVAR